MKRYIYTGFALLLALGATIRAAEAEFSEVEYYQKLAAAKLAENQKDDASEKDRQPQATATSTVTPALSPTPKKEAREAPCLPNPCLETIDCDQANTITVTPKYFHSRNDKTRFRVGGDRLEMARGRANGFGVSALYNRKLNEFLSLGFAYEYNFMSVAGGTPVPRDSGNYNRENSRWHSHTVGILPEFALGGFGTLQLSVMQSFDRASGSETVGAERRGIDDFETNTTSLMAWYKKDFQLGCSNWTVTPYAGWRSLYVDQKDANDWSQPNPHVRKNDNSWVHLAAGGLALNYRQGAYGFNARGGVSYRTSGNTVHGYGNRAVAPGVFQYSHRANLDRAVGTLGAGVSYAINRQAAMALGYDGYFGKDTSAHMGSLSFVLSF